MVFKLNSFFYYFKLTNLFEFKFVIVTNHYRFITIKKYIIFNLTSNKKFKY